MSYMASCDAMKQSRWATWRNVMPLEAMRADMQTCPSLKLDVTQMYFFDRSVCHQLGDTLRAIRVDLPTFFKHIQILQCRLHCLCQEGLMAPENMKNFHHSNRQFLGAAITIMSCRVWEWRVGVWHGHPFCLQASFSNLACDYIMHS